MDDLTLQKIAISGPTLASMMQRFSSSPGDVDGLLFGHVTHITPTLTDDSPQTLPAADSPHLVATVTSFFCPTSPLSFYDSLGRVDSVCLHRFLSAATSPQHHFLGWFSARRKTPIRPSMREFSVSNSLSTKSQLSFPIKDLDAENPTNFTPCVFFLFATPIQDQLIHTHEYRAYQFRGSTTSFEPKPIDIVNIGPAFRGHYGSFSPNSPFPLLKCDWRNASAMNEDRIEDSLSEKKLMAKEQKELDMCTEGFDIANLRRLVMGSSASHYTEGLEDLYGKMLAKIKILAAQVERSNAQVLEQENHNRKLRYKIAGSGVE